MNKVINLSGKMSILGVTKLTPTVIEAMNEAANSFYLVKELKKEIEQNVTKHFNAKNTFITSSATAGIVSTILAMREQRKQEVEKDLTINVILPAGHHINYGAPIKKIIELAGAKVIAIGSSNKLDEVDLQDSLSLSPDLAFYVSSHHATQKDHISPEKFAEFYKNNNINTAIDIAAEEDVWRFIKMNFTYTILSGSKAISGPTSGMVFCENSNKPFLDKTYLNEGRAMKISKENIVGLNQAIKEYKKQRQVSSEEKNIQTYIDLINKETKLQAKINIDEKRKISRILISTKNKKDIFILIKELHKNYIFTREYLKNYGCIELDLRQTTNKELLSVIQIMKGMKND